MISEKQLFDLFIRTYISAVEYQLDEMYYYADDLQFAANAEKEALLKYEKYT